MLAYLAYISGDSPIGDRPRCIHKRNGIIYKMYTGYILSTHKSRVR